MITDLKFRDLTPEDVEVRAAMVRSNGVSLLIYKDARVDQTILDETVGQLNWKKSYKVVKDNLYCTIEIWDDEKKQWIAKEDCGVESNTEKEKGEASDAQKRAGFAWGIGRELYSAPFIWISNKDCTIEEKTKGTFTCKDRFSVVSMEIENKKIVDLQILNNNTGEIVFQMKKVKAPLKLTAKKAEAKTEVKETKKPMTLQDALNFEIMAKSGKMVAIKDTIAACKTKESQEKLIDFLKQEVKKKNENSEACLIIYRALQKKEISFS